MEKSDIETLRKAVKSLYAFVITRMKAGEDKAAISERLVEMGMDRSKAADAADTIYDEVLETAAKEQFTSDSILPAILGGSLAAAVGGILWGWIAIGFQREIGFMAWGLGLLAGFAVVWFSKGRKGVPLQVIAVISSILGIAVGKYTLWYHYAKAAIEKTYGSQAAAELSLFSEKMLQLFIERIGSMVSGFDLLWVVLAVITAWRIPRGLGIKLPESYIPPVKEG